MSLKIHDGWAEYIDQLLKMGQELYYDCHILQGNKVYHDQLPVLRVELDYTEPASATACIIVCSGVEEEKALVIHMTDLALWLSAYGKRVNARSLYERELAEMFGSGTDW